MAAQASHHNARVAKDARRTGAFTYRVRSAAKPEVTYVPTLPDAKPVSADDPEATARARACVDEIFAELTGVSSGADSADAPVAGAEAQEGPGAEDAQTRSPQADATEDRRAEGRRDEGPRVAEPAFAGQDSAEDDARVVVAEPSVRGDVTRTSPDEVVAPESLLQRDEDQARRLHVSTTPAPQVVPEGAGVVMRRKATGFFARIGASIGSIVDKDE